MRTLHTYVIPCAALNWVGGGEGGCDLREDVKEGGGMRAGIVHMICNDNVMCMCIYIGNNNNK